MIESYDDAIAWLFNRINYERLQAGSFSSGDFKLDRMAELLRRLGNPQERIPVVHIAGTKGKGSTAVMLAGILRSAGYRTGLFTSPHIERFEERMLVDGEQPRGDELQRLTAQCHDVVLAMDEESEQRRTTFFEVTTALAWLFFASRAADVAVLEVGLGGRLDATNICQPDVCVITNISRDHTAILGRTEEKIAAEKAGIVKPGIPVVTGCQHDGALQVIRAICAERGAELLEAGRDFRVTASRESHGAREIDVTVRKHAWPAIPVPLVGVHQSHNAALAIAAAQLLVDCGYAVTPEQARAGLTKVTFPARIEIVSNTPLIIIDAAHNEASCQALVDTLDQFPQRPRTLILAATRGKDISTMLDILLPAFERIVVTQYLQNPRFVPLDELAELVRGRGVRAQVAANPTEALALARKITGPDELICVTGSFFVAAETRALLVDSHR